MKSFLLILTVVTSFMVLSCKEDGSDETCRLALNSACTSGQFYKNLSPVCEPVVLTKGEEYTDSVEVTMEVMLESRKPMRAKEISGCNVSLTYRDAHGKDADATKLPLDPDEHKAVLAFVREGRGEVKAFKFKGMMQIEEVDALIAAEKRFLNLVNVKFK